jgi:hypothetical protein
LSISITEALRLPVEERAKLIIEVVAMVDRAAAEDPTEVERAWAAELELRIARADANPNEGIDWGSTPCTQAQRVPRPMNCSISYRPIRTPGTIGGAGAPARA